jgi:hypothetical protein
LFLLLFFLKIFSEREKEKRGVEGEGGGYGRYGR